MRPKDKKKRNCLGIKIYIVKVRIAQATNRRFENMPSCAVFFPKTSIEQTKMENPIMISTKFVEDTMRPLTLEKRLAECPRVKPEIAKKRVFKFAHKKIMSNKKAM